MAESIKLKKLNIFNVLFGYNNQLEDEENTALLSKEQIKKREEVDNCLFSKFFKGKRKRRFRWNDI